MLKKIGVLALQGAFIEHIRILLKLGVEAEEIRLPAELDNIHGLIIPGGESTTMGKLMTDFELIDKIKKLGNEGLPILGTCAGMIVLAKKINGRNNNPISIMDIEVDRNAFGRQVDSFEIDLDIPVIGKNPFHAIFIRAPKLKEIGPDVEILAKLPDSTPVAVRQHNLLALSFHPELTLDYRLHEYFLRIVGNT
ncbi:MAG: pyridoxal 5'-phosphate synthase glutaminase subunit PdxT [Chloroflexi bacterium]|nr:pyridoxal 5'-phosphate synthase glutaminase subunit PdxT [Chloroflexota bacterium]